jgi:ankyrin repeat protein
MSRNPKHEMLNQARKGHLGRIERLIGRDVDINCQGKFGQTPLFEAAIVGQLDAVRFLLNHGADPGILSNDGAGPLFFACARGYVEIVGLLIEHGANVNASRRTDLPHGTAFCSPLQIAISNRHDEIAKKLVDAGANLDHRVWGMTMVEYAARQGCQDFLGYVSSMKIKNRAKQT